MTSISSWYSVYCLFVTSKQDMGILGLAKLIADVAPNAVKETDLKNYFGESLSWVLLSNSFLETFHTVFMILFIGYVYLSDVCLRHLWLA